METVKGKKRSKKFGAAQRGEMEVTGEAELGEAGWESNKKEEFKIERRTRSV